MGCDCMQIFSHACWSAGNRDVGRREIHGYFSNGGCVDLIELSEATVLYCDDERCQLVLG